MFYHILLFFNIFRMNKPRSILIKTFSFKEYCIFQGHLLSKRKLLGSSLEFNDPYVYCYDSSRLTFKIRLVIVDVFNGQTNYVTPIVPLNQGFYLFSNKHYLKKRSFFQKFKCTKSLEVLE